MVDTMGSGSRSRTDSIEALAYSLAAAAMSSTQDTIQMPASNCTQATAEPAISHQKPAAGALPGTKSGEACPELPGDREERNTTGPAHAVEEATFIPECLLPNQLNDDFLPLESPKRRTLNKARPMRDGSKILSPAQKAHIVSGFYRSHRGQSSQLVGGDEIHAKNAPIGGHSVATNSTTGSSPQPPGVASTTGTSSSYMATNLPGSAASLGSQVMASALSHQASALVAGTTRREEQHNSKAVPAWASEQQQMLAASGRLQPGTSLLLHQTCQVQGEDTAGDQPQGGAETEAGCSSSPGHMTISKSPEHTSQQVDSGSDEEDQQRSSAMKRYLAIGREKRSVAPESGIVLSFASQKRSKRQLGNPPQHNVHPFATDAESEVQNRINSAFEVLNATASDKAQEWQTTETLDRLEQHSIRLRAQPHHGAATLKREGGGASTARAAGATAASNRKQAQPANAPRAGKAGKAGAEGGVERLDFEIQEDVGVWAEGVADKAGTAAACASRAQIQAALIDPKVGAGDAEQKGKEGGKKKRGQRQRRWSDGGEGKGTGRVKRKPAAADLYKHGYGEEETRDASLEARSSPGTNQGTQSESSPSPNQRGIEASQAQLMHVVRHASTRTAIKPQYAAVEASAVARALKELDTATSTPEHGQDPQSRVDLDSWSCDDDCSEARRGRPRDPGRASMQKATDRAAVHACDDHNLPQSGSARTSRFASPNTGKTQNSLLSAAGVIKRQYIAPSAGGKGAPVSSSGVAQTTQDCVTTSGCPDDSQCPRQSAGGNAAECTTAASAECTSGSNHLAVEGCVAPDSCATQPATCPPVSETESQVESSPDAIKSDGSQPDSTAKGKEKSRLRASLSEPSSSLRQLLRRLQFGNEASPDGSSSAAYHLSRFQEISQSLPLPVRSTLEEAVAAAQLLSGGNEESHGHSGQPAVSTGTTHVSLQPHIAPQFHASSPPLAAPRRSQKRATTDSQDAGAVSPSRESSSALLAADSGADMESSGRNTFIVVEGRSRSADTAPLSGDLLTADAPGKLSGSNVFASPGKRPIMMQVSKLATAGEGVKAITAMSFSTSTAPQQQNDRAHEGGDVNSPTRSAKQAPVHSKGTTQHPHRSSKHTGALQPAPAVPGGRLKAAAFGRRASRAPALPRGSAQTSNSKHQGYGSGTAIKSEAIGFVQKVSTSPTSATLAACESEDFCHVLVGDTTSIWRADADSHATTAHASAKNPHQSPTGAAGGSPGGGGLLSQVEFNQEQLRDLWSSANLQPSYLLPSTHSMLTDGPGALSRSAMQHSQHIKRMGAMREHQLRERIQAATQLHHGPSSSSPSSLEMYGMLTQQRDADVSEGTDVATGSASAAHAPGALVSSISPSRLIANAGDRGSKASKHAFPLGPRTTELMDRVENREFRSEWRS